MGNTVEDNLTAYDHPDKYDELYSGYTEDLRYIMEAAKGVTAPIVELACGTGRLTVPMAMRGWQMIGVDIHAGMLELAKRKAEKEVLTIRFEQQDCTELNLGLVTPLIFMTGNSFQHFLTNDSQDRLFQSVKAHLEPGGEFVFDTRNPLLAELASGEKTEERKTDAQGNTIVERNTEVYDHLAQILHCQMEQETWKSGECMSEETEAISLRYTFPMELERLLHTHGFEMLHLYGSWRKDLFTKDSVSIVVHCRSME